MSKGIDVLAVMGKSLNAAMINANQHGGSTLSQYAKDVANARAALAELIEAVSPFAVLADQLDATEDTEAADDEEWVKFRMTVKDYRRLRAALSRVRGAE